MAPALNVDTCPLTPAADPQVFPQGGTCRGPYSSAFSLSPSSGPTHRVPSWGAARGEPALSVFSGQHSLHLNLPSDELSLNSALKAPLAPADNVCIPFLMLQWNGMDNGFFALGQNQQAQMYLLEKAISFCVALFLHLFFFCGLLQRVLETIKHIVTLALMKISPLSQK